MTLIYLFNDTDSSVPGVYRLGGKRLGWMCVCGGCKGECSVLFLILLEIYLFLVVFDYTGQQPKCFRNKLSQSQLIWGH